LYNNGKINKSSIVKVVKKTVGNWITKKLLWVLNGFKMDAQSHIIGPMTIKSNIDMMIHLFLVHKLGYIKATLIIYLFLI
jgi:hypothetical protein